MVSILSDKAIDGCVLSEIEDAHHLGTHGTGLSAWIAATVPATHQQHQTIVCNVDVSTGL